MSHNISLTQIFKMKYEVFSPDYTEIWLYILSLNVLLTRLYSNH